MRLIQGPTVGETTYYQINDEDWNNLVPLKVQAVLSPSQWLKFVDVAAKQDIFPKSKKILVLTMERLLFVHRLKHITELISRCYDQQITIILDVAIDDIPEYDCPTINKHFLEVAHLLDERYFKILISVPKNRLHIDSQFYKYVVYYNYWAYQGVYNFNEWGDPQKVHDGRKFHFSCMIGRLFREPRIYFISQLMANSLLDDKFFTCAEPFALDVLDLISISQTKPKHNLNVTEQDMFDNVIDILKCCSFELNISPDKIQEYVIDKHPFLKNLPGKTKHHLKHFFNKIIFDHPFVDRYGNPTSMSEMNDFEEHVKRNYHHNINHTHWDKLIPLQVYDSYVNFACEGFDPYFSEKTYKPILAGVPFVNIISQHFTKMFKELGFEPYYGLFDYSYEKIGHPYDRIDNLCKQLVNHKKDRHFELRVREQVGVVEHNQNQLRKIANDFNYITQL